MTEAVTVPELSRCLSVLGFDYGLKVHSECLGFDFRNANTLIQQINIIKNVMPTIGVRRLCEILNISTRRYYKVVNQQFSNTEKSISPPPNQLLTIEEEQTIIEHIRQAQINNDCLTGKDVRELASQLYQERTKDIRDFNRDWCWKFMKRHQDKIAKVSASSIEDNRAQIDPNEVERYIQEIEALIANPPIPQLLINFDETGFNKRPEKGKRKNVFVCKDCNANPYWREDTDLHHISLVTAITAACTSLRPLCLSTRKTFDEDIHNTFFFRWGSYFQTRKGYMTQQSMVYWVRNILAPYVRMIRENTDGPKHCVIICDGCSSHFGEDVQKEFEEIGEIKIIFIPPHSSHITQMLDAALFAILKRKYSATPKEQKLISKFTQKLIRIKKSYQAAVNEEIIRCSWEATGFILMVHNGVVVGYGFSDEFKAMLRAASSHTEIQFEVE